ncbi:MAG: PqqD family peptide modification chaperone [Candidatus Binataceae bacterium]
MSLRPEDAISPASIVVAADDQISCDLAGEAAILNLKDGVYYGLDKVGADVWKLISTPRRVSEICDTLIECYDVDRHQCLADVVALLRDLAASGLIHVRDEMAN